VKALALKDFQWVKDKDGKAVAEFCPMGQGQVDFEQYFGFFRDTGFVGPVNIHFEHSDLLGTDVGTWKPAMSKAQILALFRADLEFTRGKMRAAGLV
jgi:sugar phosphate isomerase/epimerase